MRIRDKDFFCGQLDAEVDLELLDMEQTPFPFSFFVSIAMITTQMNYMKPLED